MTERPHIGVTITLSAVIICLVGVVVATIAGAVATADLGRVEVTCIGVNGCSGVSPVVVGVVALAIPLFILLSSLDGETA